MTQDCFHVNMGVWQIAQPNCCNCENYEIWNLERSQFCNETTLAKCSMGYSDSIRWYITIKQISKITCCTKTWRHACPSKTSQIWRAFVNINLSCLSKSGGVAPNSLITLINRKMLFLATQQFPSGPYKIYPPDFKSEVRIWLWLMHMIILRRQIALGWEHFDFIKICEFRGFHFTSIAG